MSNTQVLRRKLAISQKNDFFKSSIQILFNRTFIDQYIVSLKPFYINKYVSKYSTNFFSNAPFKLKFPLEGKALSNESIFFFEKFYKKVVLVVSSMFIYLTKLNIFSIYNISFVLNILIKIFLSSLFIMLCGILFFSN